MVKKIVFVCAVLLAGVVLASCTGNKNIANTFPDGGESAAGSLSNPDQALLTMPEYCAQFHTSNECTVPGCYWQWVENKKCVVETCSNIDALRDCIIRGCDWYYYSNVCKPGHADIIMDNKIALENLVFPAYNAFSYLPRDVFPYFPWDDFLYFPWLEMPYLPWENLPYLPWDKYPGFPWDELPYFPWDDLPYLPGDHLPYLPEIPDWHVTLTPPWQFVDIGCPNMQTVAITIQTDLMDNPPIQVEDCSSPYTCYPVDGHPGRYYCTANKPIYSSKNCPIKICVQLGKELSCQELDPGVSIDCPSQQPTPTNVPPFCPTLNDAVSCRLHANDGCVWNSLVKPARCEGP